MLARFVQKGESIDYRPDTPVAAGDVVVQDNLVGIARLDIPAGTLGSLAVVGVFDVEKDSSAVAAGNAVYWNAEAKKATTAKTGISTSARRSWTPTPPARPCGCCSTR